MAKAAGVFTLFWMFQQNQVTALKCRFTHTTLSHRLVSSVGFLDGHESSNMSTARKSSHGHIKPTARQCSVFWGGSCRYERGETWVQLCPLSLPLHQQEGNTVKSLVLPLSCTCGLFGASLSLHHWGEQGCAQWSGCITLFACAAFSVVVVFPTLSKHNFFLAVEGPKSPRRKGGGVLICSYEIAKGLCK